MAITARSGDAALAMLNKVPEVTLYFWIIKVMATTVGETAADYFNFNLGFGLTNTTLVTAALLAGVLVVQLTRRRYLPSAYWLTVVLVSVAGTLVTDYMTDEMAIPLEVSTLGFAALLAVTFAIWYAIERTLSIHTIVTTRRELFYWAAILVTFALGTAGGDYASEGLGWGYMTGIGIFGGLIAAVAFAYYVLRLNAVLSFWLAYILTRPLGASIGDYLSQSPADGGLGLSGTAINGVFLVTMVALVGYLTWSRIDQPDRAAMARA